MIDKKSDQFKLQYSLWMRAAVQELIRRETSLQMPIRTVGEYFKRLGFTPHWPEKRAYELWAPEVRR